MPTYNYKSRELIAKIVYYGPGRCGKTTNLQQIHARMRPETRSELLSVATETDRTIYFDLLPLNLGTISGMKFMVRLFTVPGQVYYAETRKLVLRGADGVVFVADSQDHMLDENRQSLRDLKDNLAANGIDYNSIPLVFQYNKRDLPRLVSEAELDAVLNDRGVKASAAVASEGTGVLETLRFVTLAVFNHIKQGGKAEPRVSSSPSLGAPPPGPGYGFSAPAGTGSSPQLAPPAPFPAPTPLTASGGALQRAMATAAAAGQSRQPPPPPQANAPTAIPKVNTGSMNALPSIGAEPQRARAVPPPPPGAAAFGAATPSNARTGSRPPAPASSSSPPPSPRAGGAAPAPNAPRTAPQTSAPMPLNPNGPQPVRIGPDLVMEEFKNLAVMHSQMAERLAAVENELTRLGRENQEIRELLARQNLA